MISKYGINHKRFFVEPGLTLKLYALNSSRPLFKGNPELRRAVNNAINRTELVLRNVEQATDQYLPPARPGIQGPPDLPPRGRHATREGARGGQLADWQGRLLCARLAPEAERRTGSQGQLSEIGLEVEIRTLAEFATASAYRGRLGNADEPWDLAIIIWTPDFVDPSGYINRLLDAQSAGGTNLAQFDDGAFLDLMRQAARRQGSARDKAYATLDLQLGRDAAPLVPIAVLNEATLVSPRTGCIVLRPGLVLTNVCLKR